MSIAKKIIISAVCLALAAAIIFACVTLAYYPHYAKAKRQLQISDSARENGQVQVMSCNLRCFTPTDFGRRSWFYRADLIMKNIENNAPDVIGFQEATKVQYKYLCEAMPEYDSIITYRDKSSNSEGCPVFYRRDSFTLIDKGSFWLSETPDKMSRDWGAACYRICSYAILKDNATGKEFVVFNTHLDHVSDTARINGIKVVLDKIAQFGGKPAVLMGDLNADENSETYSSAVENFSDVKYMTDNTMKSCTYQDWGQALDNDCIDYILVSKTGFKVSSYKVVTDTYDGVYPSDHFPITASLILE